jgi:hypothetical protein
VVKLPQPGGVSPTYILSIYTEHAEGGHQMVSDPVRGGTGLAGGTADEDVISGCTDSVTMGVCICVSIDELPGE